MSPRSPRTYQRVGVTALEQAKKGPGQVAHDPLPRSYQPVTHRATHRLPSGLKTLPGWQIHADWSLLSENLGGTNLIRSAACNSLTTHRLRRCCNWTHPAEQVNRALSIKSRRSTCTSDTFGCVVLVSKMMGVPGGASRVGRPRRK